MKYEVEIKWDIEITAKQKTAQRKKSSNYL